MKDSETGAKCIYERVVNIEGNLLTYRLLFSRDENDPDGYFDIYSLSITLNDGNEEEEILLEDISRCKDSATVIADIFADGSVTPNTAMCVIEDLFS